MVRPEMSFLGALSKSCRLGIVRCQVGKHAQHGFKAAEILHRLPPHSRSSPTLPPYPPSNLITLCSYTSYIYAPADPGSAEIAGILRGRHSARKGKGIVWRASPLHRNPFFIYTERIAESLAFAFLRTCKMKAGRGECPVRRLVQYRFLSGCVDYIHIYTYIYVDAAIGISATRVQMAPSWI